MTTFLIRSFIEPIQFPSIQEIFTDVLLPNTLSRCVLRMKCPIRSLGTEKVLALVITVVVVGAAVVTTGLGAPVVVVGAAVVVVVVGVAVVVVVVGADVVVTGA